VALAAWLLVSPFVIGYHDIPSTAMAVGAALVCAVIAFVDARENTAAPANFIVALGALLAVWGIAGCFLPNGAGPNEIIVGLLWTASAFVITKIQPADEVVAYDVYGNPMAQVKTIGMKDGNISAKAVLLGSMPSTMYLRPEEVWKLLGMMSFETIKELPKFLIVGAKRVNEGAAKAEKKQ
jgi:hypothetical protein